MIGSVCVCVASGAVGGALGGVTRKIIDGNFDSIVEGAINGAVRGLFGGVVGVLVGTAMPVFFGIDALCERVIFINAASVGTGIGAFIGVNKYSETPLNERNVTVLPR